MLIPRSGDFIKHRASMDVAIRIDKVYRFDHKWKIKGTWYNQAFVETYCMGYPVRFELPTRHLGNWLLCMKPNAKCIRDVEWRPLK